MEKGAPAWKKNTTPGCDNYQVCRRLMLMMRRRMMAYTQNSYGRYSYSWILWILWNSPSEVKPMHCFAMDVKSDWLGAIKQSLEGSLDKRQKSKTKHFLRKVKVSLWAHCQSDWFPYSVLDLKKTNEMKQNKTKHAEFSNVFHFHFLSLLTWKYYFLCLKLTVHKRRQSPIGGDGSRSFRWWLHVVKVGSM